jgi:hypothetical protein
MTSTGFIVTYSLMCRKYTSHIQPSLPSSITLSPYHSYHSLKWAFFVLLSFFSCCYCARWGKVHCDIYKSSCNVSNIPYLNSLPPPFSFIPILFLEWFQQVSFLPWSIHVHIFHSVFTLLSPFPATSLFPWSLPPSQAGSVLLL